MALQQDAVSTVLAIDVSWAMDQFHIWPATFEAVVALNDEVRASRPDDDLEFVTFSAYAERIVRSDLSGLTWDESILGTNLQHAALLAHEILDTSACPVRRLIVVTLGDPSAHLDNDRSYFAYPPSPVMIRETLAALHACRAAGISVTCILVKPSNMHPGTEQSVVEFAFALFGIIGVRIVRSSVDRVAADLRAVYFNEPA